MIKYFNKVDLKKTVLVGDLNIAPYENDVWSHKQLLSVVSHTPIETDLLNKLIDNLNWVDVGRKYIPTSIIRSNHPIKSIIYFSIFLS